ncbi:MAG: hypothetical protein ACI8RD_005028 [Bacillariaceae sp.]|jgi:hypothetical protein
MIIVVDDDDIPTCIESGVFSKEFLIIVPPFLCFYNKGTKIVWKENLLTLSYFVGVLMVTVKFLALMLGQWSRHSNIVI